MHRCATATERRQTRGVVVAEIGMREQFARHHRHRAQGVHLLSLNQLERFLGIPLVHQHQLAAAQGRAVHDAIIGCDMKQRCGHQRRRGRRRHRCIDHISSTQRLRRRKNLPHGRHVHNVVNATPMRELSALGTTCGTRRIEDTSIVVGVDGGHGQLPGLAHRVGPLHRLYRRRGLTHSDDSQI